MAAVPPDLGTAAARPDPQAARPPQGAGARPPGPVLCAGLFGSGWGGGCRAAVPPAPGPAAARPDPEAAGSPQGAGTRPRVLFICADPVGEQMAGLGIRCWELDRKSGGWGTRL